MPFLRFAVLFLVSLPGTLFAQPSSPAVGELLQPQGAVEVLRAGTTIWLSTTNSVALQPGDTVRTGPNSRAAIRLSNESVVRMDERSLLQLRPPKKPDGVLLNLLKGASYFFHRERPVRTEFETPLVSGAVRGTESHLLVEDNGRSVLSLLEGAVDLANDHGTLTLASGEQAIVEPQQPPQSTALIAANSIIQWCLYYPAVIDLDELVLTVAERRSLAQSLTAYRQGDLPAAVAAYPATRTPASDGERVYLAALRLAAGGVNDANELLAGLNPDRDARAAGLADALRMLIAAVKFEPHETHAHLEIASSLLAASYYDQSRADLESALAHARQAVERSPQWGFGWARLAELELSFGNVSAAHEAIDRALEFSPRHAQAHAVRGFLLAGAYRIGEATDAFDTALGIDSALGNAWLGRGLCRLRRGDSRGGMEDLLVAAALEPNRAVLRSYLGKAFHHLADDRHATNELALAMRLDPNDPTAWFYSALLNQQRNQVNDAIRDLEASRELNDNRRIYRSRLLLDQDQAVRRANLANIYREAGMEDVGAREAVRAVNDDYANYSAHLFLADSYNLLRQPGHTGLRYETATFSELLVANLLAPAGAGLFSRHVTQQDYTRLFERDGLGVTSATEYRSGGDWLQNASQFGSFGALGYALDASYLSRNGERPNNDLNSLGLAGAFKAQVTARDSLYLQTVYSDFESGDLRQFYDQADANHTLRIDDEQAANVFAGWHREWHPGSHTLVLLGHLNDDYQFEDGAMSVLTVFKTNGTPASVSPAAFGFRQFDSQLRNEFRAWSGELQQIWQHASHTIVAGARYQSGENETRDDLTKQGGQLVNYPTAPQDISTELERTSVYLYETWRIAEPFSLLGGLTYDHLRYPRNIDLPPITSGEETKEQFSPKVGVLWTPTKSSAARAAYTRSLGGLYYDNSVRLEPAQFGGFVQSYRSLIPDSLAGAVPGSEFETWSAEVEHRFPTHTYLGLRGEWLSSDARRDVGVFDVDVLNNPTDAVPGSTPEHLDFRERSLLFTANQLLAREWSFGLRYRLAEAELEQRLPAISPDIYAQSANDHRAVLHQLWMTVNYNHPSGFFSQFQSLWTAQDNSGYTPSRSGDDFWQFNVLAGWRLWRRQVEVTLGVLNLTDQDYQLNPLTLYHELPRERTLFAALRFSF